MKGTKGAIWRGLAFITILALILGALPLAPTALAAEGGTRLEAKHLWSAGEASKSLAGSVTPNIPFWYHVGFTTNTQGVDLKLESMTTVFDVFFGSESRMSNTRFFNLPSGSQIGDYYVQVRGYMADAYTISATPSTGTGGTTPPGGTSPTPTPSPSPTVTAGDGSSRTTPARLLLGTPYPGSLSSIMARWFLFDYSGADAVTVDLQGDPVLGINVYKGSNQYQESGGSYTRFFTLQGSFNAGQYFFEVRGTSPGMAFTISAHTGAGGGAAGDSRANPQVLTETLPINLNITSAVSSKWFSRDFSGAHDLDISVGTPDPTVQLWVYEGSRLYALNSGARSFSIPQSSSPGPYVFEVRNVQGVKFSITVSEPAAAGACSQDNPCDLTADQPAPGNITSGGAKWFRYLHASAGRRADVMLRKGPPSVKLNVMRGNVSNAIEPGGGSVTAFPLGNNLDTWYFEVKAGQYMGGSFEIVVQTQTASDVLPPGGGDNQYSSPEIGVGHNNRGQLLPNASTWFRFGYFGEPAAISVTSISQGPILMDVYFGYSPNPLTRNNTTYSLGAASSSGDYYIKLLGGPNGGVYELKIVGTGGPAQLGSSPSSAISLPDGESVNQSYIGNKIWFAYKYQLPFQPVNIALYGAGASLAFDVFFEMSPAPMGTSRPAGSDQAFDLMSPNRGTYYFAIRPMGYMPQGAPTINFSMKASAGAGPSAGLPLGDRFNPQPLEDNQGVKGNLSPQQNYWYSYDIPDDKKVEIALTLAAGDRGTALNIYGSDPNPIAPGVRSWTMPPFFGQPSVLINVVAPFGGGYSLIANTKTAAAGDGSSREKAIPLPGEVDISDRFEDHLGVSRLWYVYQHTGTTVQFGVFTGPGGQAKLDIYVGDSNFPQPGSGGLNGFVGTSTPPGPIFLAVSGSGPFHIKATIQQQVGGAPPAGPDEGGFTYAQPSTAIKAGVYDCANPATLVPYGRVAILYNGQAITTVMAITGTINIAPTALPNGGKDGHYDLRGLPPKGSDITSDTQAGANCAPGYNVGVEVNGGLVFPIGDPQVGQRLMLQGVQLQGKVTGPAASDGTPGDAIANARVKAIPDFGGAAGGMGAPGMDDQSVLVKTNSQGNYKMGGFMPGIPYLIVAYPPEPGDGGPGAYAQSLATPLSFSGAGFGFGFVGTPGGAGGFPTPPPGGFPTPLPTPPPGGFPTPPPGGFPTPPPGTFPSAAASGVKPAAEQAKEVNLSLTKPDIIGQVKNPDGGTVAGSKVVAQEEFSGGFGPSAGPQSSSVNIEGYSGSNGAYRLGALSSGKTYKIVAKPPKTGDNSQYKASQPKKPSYTGTQLTGVDLTLAGTQITVTVNSGGVGVPGAMVNLNSMSSFGPGVFYEEKTDPNGRATFGGLGDGQYNVMSFPPPDPKYFSLAPAAPQQAKVSSGTASPSSLSFNLGAATLTGIVYKSDGNPATGNVSVEIFKTNFTFQYGVGVNQQGAFAAGGMPAGDYKVQAKVQAGSFSFGQQSQDTDSAARDVTIGPDGKPDSSWDGKLTLGKPQVTIYVVDPVGKTPAFPVHVSEVGSNGEPIGEGTETDMSTGQALIGGLADGAHQFSVFLPPMLPFAAPDNQTVTISNGIAVSSTVTFQLISPKKKIKGAIKKADGSAVTNAGVHAFREDGSGNSDTFVDSIGSYELKLAKGGSWLLVLFPRFEGAVSNEGAKQVGRSIKELAAQLDWIFTEEPRRVEFTSSDSTDETVSGVNFTVGKANASVKGKVLMESTGQAPDANTTFVDVRDEAGVGNGVPLSEDGTFNVAVPSGITARVRVFSKDPSLSQKGEAPYVEPKEGTPVDVGNIYLTKLALSISGKVVISGATDSNGETVGVENIEVSAFKEGGLGFARTTSSTGGVFTLPVGGGEWRLQARPGKGSKYTPKGRPVEVEVKGDAVSGTTLEVQAADGEITAQLAWAQGVTPPFAISSLFGFGIALEQPSNSLAAGTPMERGTFKLRVASGKKYTVSVDFPPGLSYGATPQTADLTTGATATVQIPVSIANANIIGEFKDSAGTRVQNLDADVFASGPKGQKSTALSATGRYNLSLIAGTWFIGGKVKSSGYALVPPANNKVEAVAADIVDGPTFTVVQAAGKIAGTVKDPSGNGLIARVWAETKPASAGEAPRLVADAVSASDGSYSMNAPAGTVVVRAAVPPEKGYLPPLPIQAEVPSTGQVTVNFQFRAPEVTIKGNVSGPGAATALVTGYSDKGAWSSTTVTTTGTVSYTLNATTNDTWHLVATSSISSTVYRSDSVTITVGTTNITGRSVRSAATDLVLKEVTSLTLPAGASVTFDSTSMQVLALDDGTQVTIPSGALATSGNVTVYAVPTEKLTSQPSAQARFIGYNLKAFDSNNVEIKKFKQNVTLRVPYPSDAILAASGIEESKLKPMYYDTTSGSWVVSEPYTQDTVNNMFIITTDHFTIFAGILTSGAQQVGSSMVKIYVPYLSKNFSPGW